MQLTASAATQQLLRRFDTMYARVGRPWIATASVLRRSSPGWHAAGDPFRTRASGDWLCHSNLSASMYQLLTALIRSATISAIKMVVGLIATEGVSGMIEASPT